MAGTSLAFAAPKASTCPFLSADFALKIPSWGRARLRLIPEYRAKPALDDLFRYVIPGSDEYITEQYAAEVSHLLEAWTRELESGTRTGAALTGLPHPTMQAGKLIPFQEISVRKGYSIDVLRRKFTEQLEIERQVWIEQMQKYLAEIAPIRTAELQIVEITEVAGPTPTIRATIRYELVGTFADRGREQRIGNWLTEWLKDGSGGWRATKWQSTEEIVSRAREPIFVDITSQTFGALDSYKEQLLHGVDYWRSVLDGACGIDVYGNQGIAVGDIDGDGCDDLYVCQPAGLPNRLYRNRGDGTFQDVTEKSGVGVLDSTSSALFADFENKGVQDLLVLCANGPLLFLNDGRGKYFLKRDAFKFAQPPQGAFTHVAAADYDCDGRLDIYLCTYSYYLGLDQYRYPVPYFDARNGPPNFLFHNEGNATFGDYTRASGLNVDNDRYSFACAWGDSNSNGWPDLYVVNDFGRSNLYRNNGDGTFTSISAEAGVEDPGAGMSACWFDFDNDGKQDIYVANMWSAAGMRVSSQSRFQKEAPEAIRALYRHHARGNSLYRNKGSFRFENVAQSSGTDMGRWAWCSDAWDFDHDGYSDLYIANGYVSAAARDLSSFFWRHVVAKSPHTANSSTGYEQGWNAINELIRSDSSWSGGERNVVYLNNRDATFSDVSGVVGLDFSDDSRSFGLLDLDGDGRLEIALKNRTAPQLRVLRNAMNEIARSISFRLQGTESNRDAIGAAVTVEAAGHRQTRYLQAGSGFLSQHTKELFFGLGESAEIVTATVRWPTGLVQIFKNLPAGHRIEIVEGSGDFRSRRFSESRLNVAPAEDSSRETVPESSETWLLEPLAAPDFTLTDRSGRRWTLTKLRGRRVFLFFWSIESAASCKLLQILDRSASALDSTNIRALALNLDKAPDIARVESLIGRQNASIPILSATPEVAAIYNVTYRYLFDRHRDFPIPAALLIDQAGAIVKIYQGGFDVEAVLHDANSIPSTPNERIRRALPFPGILCNGEFQRNNFTYGVALFQRGYVEPAIASFKQALIAKPDDAEAHYNLGTLYLRTGHAAEARQSLERALRLRQNYPEAWNNLGMLAGQAGDASEAIRDFERALLLRPEYPTALLNLGNLYRRQREFDKAESLLVRALKIEPTNPEANYSLGMFYAEQDRFQPAAQYLGEAIKLRPDYADALNNFGVLLAHDKRYEDAEEKFAACIRVAPDFDQGYLNLARLYMLLNQTERARQTLHSLLERQPQSQAAQQALEGLH